MYKLICLKKEVCSLAQVQKKYTFFPTASAADLLGANAPKTPNIYRKIGERYLRKEQNASTFFTRRSSGNVSANVPNF